MQNLVVTGSVLSMDKYGRARLFIDNPGIIINHIKQKNFVKFPFESDTVLIITLKKHKKYWADKIMKDIGKTISIETSPRIWNMNGDIGISLDLINIL